MSRFRVDVTASRLLRRLVLWRGFPFVFQALCLVVVISLVLVGWGHGTDVAPDDLLILRKTNLTTLLVWGLWWPTMLALALSLGRVWCTVCPAELVSRLGNVLAQRVGWPRVRLPRWAGWSTVGGFLGLQLLVFGASVHRIPHGTALVLFLLLGAALVAGLVVREPRAFCKALCPASPLLSVYGRFTPVQLDIREADVCARCTTRDCVDAGRRDRLDRRSCPSQVRPYARAAGDGCVTCFQCVQTCPHGNIGFGLVRDDATIRRPSALRPFEAVFVMSMAGFVTHEMVGEVGWLEEAFHVAPRTLATSLPGLDGGWTEALWTLAMFPLIVWSALALVARLFGSGLGFRDRLVAIATGAAPVVAIAHLAKGVAKLAGWAGYLPGALADPTGLDTLHAIASGTATAPPRLVGLGLVAWVALGALLFVGWRSWRSRRAVVGQAVPAARVGLTGSTLLFGGVLVAWTLA